MQAMEFQREALLRLLVTLFTKAGIVPDGAPVATVSRLVRNQILRVLLPIESAARRIIFHRAQRIVVPPSKPAKEPSGPGPDTLGYLSQHRRKPKRKRSGKPRKTRAAVFWLFDKLAYCPHTADPHRRPPRGGPGPRMSFFDGSDPPRDPVVEKPKRDPDDAWRLCRRLQAVLGALNDVDAQALRLRRLLDRRKAQASEASTPKSKRSRAPRTNPIRKGAPPGYRPEQTQEVDKILYACNLMAGDDPPPKGQ